MRIIAGKFKGRQIFLYNHLKTRPMMGKVLKAIFDIIGDSIVDARFLDLYAGSGLMSFEALSRGAREVVMVEIEKSAVKNILENCSNLNLPQKNGKFLGVDILNRNVFSALGKLAGQEKKFDIIFADPPFIEEIAEKTVKKVDLLAKKLLLPHSIFFIRTYKQSDINYSPQELELHDKRIYGRSILFKYQLKNDEK